MKGTRRGQRLRCCLTEHVLGNIEVNGLVVAVDVAKPNGDAAGAVAAGVNMLDSGAAVGAAGYPVIENGAAA
jgi:hypothetical protein